MNEVVRKAYVRDCEIGMSRWNRMIDKAGHATARCACRTSASAARSASWAGRPCDPEGKPMAAELWSAAHDRWLPSESDRAFVKSLMKPVTEPGKMASWIAPPDRGINNLAVDYEYVRLA